MKTDHKKRAENYQAENQRLRQAIGRAEQEIMRVIREASPEWAYVVPVDSGDLMQIRAELRKALRRTSDV